MDTITHNTYLIKALNNFEWDLEETVESLNYALSYDPENAYTLFTMARLQAERFSNYPAAKDYYAQALSKNLDLVTAYPKYVSVLILNEEYHEAMRLIDFALKIKGTNKAYLYMQLGLVLERLGKYRLAIKIMKQAYLIANDELNEHIDHQLKRIKEKIKRTRETSKKTKGKKKAKKKKK